MHGAADSAGHGATPNKKTTPPKQRPGSKEPVRGPPNKRRRPQRWLLARQDFRAEGLYRFMSGPEELAIRFERIRRRRPRFKDVAVERPPLADAA